PVALKYATNYEFLIHVILSAINDSKKKSLPFEDFLNKNFTVEQVQVLINHMFRTPNLIKNLMEKSPSSSENSTLNANNLKACKEVLDLHINILREIFSSKSYTQKLDPTLNDYYKKYSINWLQLTMQLGKMIYSESSVFKPSTMRY